MASGSGLLSVPDAGAMGLPPGKRAPLGLWQPNLDNAARFKGLVAVAAPVSHALRVFYFTEGGLIARRLALVRAADGTQVRIHGGIISPPEPDRR